MKKKKAVNNTYLIHYKQSTDIYNFVFCGKEKIEERKLELIFLGYAEVECPRLEHELADTGETKSTGLFNERLDMSKLTVENIRDLKKRRRKRK